MKLNNILLVDDNPAINYYHTKIIEMGELAESVRVVTTGEATLKYLEKKIKDSEGEPFIEPDLIVVDLNMPRMNGFELLESLPDHLEGLGKTPRVIIATSSLNPKDRERAQDTMADGYMEKPLNEDSFRNVINSLFER